METEMHGRIRAEAIEWHIRLRHGDDETWDGFAQWLAADAGHAEAYAQVEEADLAIEPLLPELVFRTAANDADEAADASIATKPGRRRWLIGGGALAASVALAVMVAPWPASDRYDVATAPGENQIVTLDATTRITLNGATRMTFDRKDPRFAALKEGEALFHVRHDAVKPFRLEVGASVVEDAGTVFNVVRVGAAVRVAVAQGRVVYNPRQQAVALDAGQGISFEDGDESRPRVDPVPAGSVGAWQRGQLVYAGETMARVAADLSRALGIRIKIAPALANKPFHGTIAVDGPDASQIDRLEFALGVEIDSGPGGWTMKPRAGAEH